MVFRWFSLFWFLSSSSRTQARAVWILGVRELMIICRTFISHICAFCLQNFLTTRPDPSRYPTFFASTRPVPSRSQKPLPVGPCIWLLTSIKHIKRINLAKCLLIMQTSYMRIITSIAYKESRYGYGWSLDESWFPGHKISLSMLWSICAISVPLYTSMVAYKSSAVANGWDNNTQ